MTTPRPEPSDIFIPIPCMQEIACFFCTEMITPEKDDFFIHVGFPGKNPFQIHASCFEQLGWSMTHFIVSNRGELIPEKVLN